MNQFDTTITAGHPAFLHSSYYYRTVTQRCKNQIEQFIGEAHRHQGAEAQYRYERAYGVYMGWRALAMDHASDDEFARDDASLEALLRNPPAHDVTGAQRP